MKLGEHISELLYEHDCVIIPDFGGFVCNYSPARIDPVKHLFEPPGKRILFNKGLIRNDGLLAHHISGKLNLTYSDVVDSMSKEVKRFNEELSKDKRLVLDNIGLLYVNEKGNLLFEQDNKLNYLIESYGLSSFFHLPVKRDGANVEPVVIPLVKERKKTRYYAAAAVITALVAGTFCFTLLDKRADLKFSSLNIFSKKEAAEYSVSSAKYSALPTTHSETLSIVAINPKTTIPEATKPVAVISSSYYSVIVGGFAEKQHADNLIKQYESQNLHLAIVGRNPQGLYLVGYGKYSSHNDAVAERVSFMKRFAKDAWVKTN